MAYLDPNRVKYIVVHVTATSLKYPLTTAALRRMHKARGFSDVGYHEWQDRSGKWHRGRPANKTGAHVRGYNSVSYGISQEGGRLKFDQTPEMMKSLETKLRQLVKKFPNAKICGHRDFSPDLDGDGLIEPHEHIKMCPQFDVIPWCRERGLPAADIKGAWDNKVDPPAKEGKRPDARDMWLQRLLQKVGYQLVADGIVGPKTKATITQFQLDNGLDQTGAFDVPTVKRLRAMVEGVERATQIPPPAPKEVVTQKKIAPQGLLKPEWKSKTIWAGRIQQASGYAVPAWSWFTDLHWGWKVAITLAGVSLVILGFRVVKDRKRWIAWAKDVKSDVQELQS